MGDAAVGKFSCDGCGKAYAWKAELAGRRVKCKCGQALSVPARDPAAATYEAPPEGFDDLYAFADEKVVHSAPAYAPVPAAAASTTRSVAGGGGRAASRGAAGGSPALLGYAAMGSKRGAGGQAATARDGNVYWSPVMDLYVPGALILAGVFCSFFEVRYQYGIKSIPVAIGAVGLLSIVNIVFGFVGILIAARLLGLGLGPLPVAVLKTAAASILPAAAASLVQSAAGFGGSLLAWFISYALSLLIFMKLMDLDYFETCVCTFIIWLVRTWVVWGILAWVFTGGLSGDGEEGGGGAGGSVLSAAMGVPEDESDADADAERRSPGAEYDDRARWALQLAKRKPEAKAWVAADPKRAFTGRTHEQSVAIVDALEKLGATFMVVPDPQAAGEKTDRAEGRSIVFVLPSDGAARRKVFEYYGTIGKTYGGPAPKDVGQTYMTIQFAKGFADEIEEDGEDDN